MYFKKPLYLSSVVEILFLKQTYPFSSVNYAGMEVVVVVFTETENSS